MARFGAPASLAIVALLLSCPPPTSLDPAYLNSATNFIAASPLDNSGAVAWELAYQDDPAATHGYVTYAAQGTVGANLHGIPAAAPVYKLSIADLLANGTFEATAAGSAPAGWEQWDVDTAGSTWTPVVPVDAAKNRVVQDATSLHYRSLSYDLAQNEFLSFPLPGMLADGGAALSTYATYDLRFEARGVNMTRGTSGWDGTAFSVSNLVIDPVVDGLAFRPAAMTNLTATVGVNPAAVLFGSTTASQTIILDDMRAVRGDLGLYLRLRLRPTDTTPALIEGYYRFSVWVRRDPADRYISGATATSAEAAAPLAATAVTLWICSLDPVLGEQAINPVTTAASAPAWDSDWVQLHVDFNKSARFDEASAAPVLELRIMPADINAPDATGILIAAPSLAFYASGY